MTGPAERPAHDVNSHRVRVEPGSHLVVRLGGIMAIIAGAGAGAGAGAPARTAELLEVLRAAAQAPGPLTGTVLSRRLTDWLAGVDDAPPFGTAAASEQGLALFLYGDAHAIIDGGMKPDVSGHDAVHAVDRVLPWPASTVRLSIGYPPPVSAFPTLPPWAGLQAGVSVGGALLLEVDRTSTTAGPSVQPQAQPVTEPLLAQRIDGAASDEKRPPLPIERTRSHQSQRERQQEAAEQAKEHPGAYVRGFRCSRGHLNDPRVSFCGVCGIRMDQLTGIMVLERRPPLGLFVLDAGTTFVLDDNYIIGRAPEVSQSVRDGGHRSIRIDDRSGSMSRVHSEVRLVDWDVLLVDLGSANGTYVAGARDVFANGAPRWTRLAPHQPFVLTPGTNVLIGRRQFIYESASARF